MEKEDLHKEPRGNATKSVLLTVGLVVVTVALVLLATIGGIYVTKLQSDCNKQPIKPDYEEKYQAKNVKNEDQEVGNDPKHHLQKVTTKDDTGKTTSTVIFNFQTRVISIHYPEDKQCYLIGGMDKDIEEFTNGFRQPTAQQEVSRHNISYDVADEKPVYDTSLVADELKEPCAKGNTYWLKRTTNGDQTATTRRKRAVCRRHCHWLCNCCQCIFSCHWHCSG